jgi:DNA-binding response OmpR family regulator
MAKILIVEDEIHIQRLTRAILDKAGHKAESVSSGEEAIDLIGKREDTFDIIILDIMMNGIDGLQVLRTLKQSPKAKNTAIVMLTALAQETVVLKGIQLGAKDYIRKPFHPKDLLERINRQVTA